MGDLSFRQKEESFSILPLVMERNNLRRGRIFPEWQNGKKCERNNPS